MKRDVAQTDDINVRLINFFSRDSHDILDMKEQYATCLHCTMT